MAKIRKRATRIIEERSIAVAKSIDTGSLEDGGKANPAQGLPGGSGINPEKEEEKKPKEKPSFVAVLDRKQEESVEAEDMSTDSLKDFHDQIHRLYRKTILDEATRSVEDLTNLHARVVNELAVRDIDHPAPPDDGLDDISSTFESKTIEKAYQKVESSGNEEGEEIILEDVLTHFETFKLRKPYIYLVGGLANHGKTKGDIDILVKDSEDMPKDYKHALHFRLGRALPGELANRLQIHYDNFHGPFTNFVELFDLTFERVNPKNEVKEMSAKLRKEEWPENLVQSIEELKSYRRAAR